MNDEIREYNNLLYSNNFKICLGPKNKSIKEAILHENTEKIIQEAFTNCNKLKKLVIESPNFYEIDTNAFKSCHSLTDVTFKSDKLIKVGLNAFKDCFIKKFKSTDFIGTGNFDPNFKKYIENIDITQPPNGIPYEFFFQEEVGGDTNLKTITIRYQDGTVKTDFIGSGEMLSAYPHKKEDSIVTIPKEYTDIEGKTFINNPFIKKLILPENVTDIYETFVVNCENIEEIYIKTKKLDFPFKKGEKLYESCPSLKSVFLTKEVYEKYKPYIQNNDIYKTFDLSALIDSNKSFKEINDLYKNKKEFER